MCEFLVSQSGAVQSVCFVSSFRCPSNSHPATTMSSPNALWTGTLCRSVIRQKTGEVFHLLYQMSLTAGINKRLQAWGGRRVVRETSVTSNRNPHNKNGGRHSWQTETNLTEIDGEQCTGEWKDLHCYKPTTALVTGLNKVQQWVYENIGMHIVELTY